MIVPRLESLLHQELRSRLVDGRLSVDLSSAGPDDVRDALSGLAEQVERQEERAAIAQLQEGLGTGGRAASGLPDTLAALHERRVETLLITPAFDQAGARCPSCGMLQGQGGGSCPADGTALQPVEHLRDAVIEATLAQDAAVLVMRHHPDLEEHQGIAALLRF